MGKYYAVRKGNKTGIVSTWDECSKHVLGYSGAEYKSFSTLKEAEEYLIGNNESKAKSKNVAYIDGSYNIKTKEYSFGGILILENKIYSFSKKYDQDEYSESRNVAGEIKGAGYIINYCIKNNIKEIDLYYDYIGIERWFNGSWKANTKIAIMYTDFAKEVKNKIKVNFYKVKSHSNNEYNDLADSLAKKALGI